MRTGLIHAVSDVDAFRFTLTQAANVRIILKGADFGPNLDAILVLGRDNTTWRQNLTTAAPANDLGEVITQNLTAGNYYVIVRSQNTLVGDIGQYTVRVESSTGGFAPITTPVSPVPGTTSLQLPGRRPRSGGRVSPSAAVPRMVAEPVMLVEATAVRAVRSRDAGSDSPAVAAHEECFAHDEIWTADLTDELLG